MTENENFNIKKHLCGLTDEYCEGMPENEKAKLLERITSDEGNKKYSVFENRSKDDPLYIVSDKGQKVYELSELSDFPTAEQLNEMEAEGKLLPNQEREKRVDEIIEKLAGNDSKISKDLAEILSKTDLEIRIRNWDRPNASVAFQKSEDEMQKNKAVLMVSDKLFQEENQEALVGFLAHEMGHVLDFAQRPDSAKTQYMDGAETFADIVGTQLAVNAGLDSRGMGKFMGDDYRETKIEYNYTPSGTFREETINTAYNSMVKVRDNEKTKDAERQEDTDKKEELKEADMSKADNKCKVELIKDKQGRPEGAEVKFKTESNKHLTISMGFKTETNHDISGYSVTMKVSERKFLFSHNIPLSDIKVGYADSRSGRRSGAYNFEDAMRKETLFEHIPNDDPIKPFLEQARIGTVDALENENRKNKIMEMDEQLKIIENKRDNEKPKDAERQEDTDKKKERKDGLKIMELQGRVSKGTDKASSRPNQQTHLQGITLPNYRRTSDGR